MTSSSSSSSWLRFQQLHELLIKTLLQTKKHQKKNETLTLTLTETEIAISSSSWNGLVSLLHQTFLLTHLNPKWMESLLEDLFDHLSLQQTCLHPILSCLRDQAIVLMDSTAFLTTTPSQLQPRSSSSSSSSSSSMRTLPFLQKVISQFIHFLPQLHVHDQRFSLGLHTLLYFYVTHCYLIVRPTKTYPRDPSLKRRMPFDANAFFFSSSESFFLTLIQRNPLCAFPLWQTLCQMYSFASSSSSSSNLTLSHPHPSSFFILLQSNLHFGLATFQLAYTLFVTLTLSLSTSTNNTPKNTHPASMVTTSSTLPPPTLTKEKEKKEKNNPTSLWDFNLDVHRHSLPSRERLLLDVHHIYISTLLQPLPSTQKETEHHPWLPYFPSLWTRLLSFSTPTSLDPFLSRPEILLKCLLGTSNTFSSQATSSSSSHHLSSLLLFVLNDLVTRKTLGQTYESELNILLTFLPLVFFDQEEDANHHHQKKKDTKRLTSASSEVLSLVRVLTVPVFAYAILSPTLPSLLLLNVLSFFKKILDLFSSSSTLLLLFNVPYAVYLTTWILPLLQLQLHPSPSIALLATELYSTLSSYLFPSTTSGSLTTPFTFYHPVHPFPSWIGPWVKDFLDGCPYVTESSLHRLVYFPWYFYAHPTLAMHYVTSLPRSFLSKSVGHLLFLFFLSTFNQVHHVTYVHLVLQHWVPKCMETQHPWLCSGWLHVLQTWATRLPRFPQLAWTSVETLVECWKTWSRCWATLRQVLGSMLATLSVQGSSLTSSSSLATQQAPPSLDRLLENENETSPRVTHLRRLGQVFLTLLHTMKETGASKQEVDDVTYLVKKFVHMNASFDGAPFTCLHLKLCQALAPWMSMSSFTSFWQPMVVKMISSQETTLLSPTTMEVWVTLFQCLPDFVPPVPSTWVVTDDPNTLPQVYRDVLDTYFVPCLPFSPSTTSTPTPTSSVLHPFPLDASSLHVLHPHALYALTLFPGWPATFSYVSSWSPRQCMHYLDAHASDPTWHQAITAVYQSMVRYEVTTTISRKWFLPSTSASTSTLLPSSSSSALRGSGSFKKKAALDETTTTTTSSSSSDDDDMHRFLVHLNHRCLDLCQHHVTTMEGSKRLQPIAYAGLLVLSPSSYPFPTFVSKVSLMSTSSLPSSWMWHRALTFTLWRHYWTSLYLQPSPTSFPGSLSSIYPSASSSIPLTSSSPTTAWIQFIYASTCRALTQSVCMASSSSYLVSATPHMAKEEIEHLFQGWMGWVIHGSWPDFFKENPRSSHETDHEGHRPQELHDSSLASTPVFNSSLVRVAGLACLAQLVPVTGSLADLQHLVKACCHWLQLPERSHATQVRPAFGVVDGINEMEMEPKDPKKGSTQAFEPTHRLFLESEKVNQETKTWREDPIVDGHDELTFEAAKALCMILAHRSKTEPSSSTLPAYLHFIQDTLSSFFFVHKAEEEEEEEGSSSSSSSTLRRPSVHTGLGLAMGVAYLQRVRPESIPVDVVDKARRYCHEEATAGTTATAPLLGLWKFYAAWILVFSKQEMDVKMLQDVYPIAKVTASVFHPPHPLFHLSSSITKKYPFVIPSWFILLGQLHGQLPLSIRLQKLHELNETWWPPSTGETTETSSSTSSGLTMPFHIQTYQIMYMVGLLGFQFVHMDQVLPPTFLDLNTDPLFPSFCQVVDHFFNSTLHHADPRLFKFVLPIFTCLLHGWQHPLDSPATTSTFDTLSSWTSSHRFMHEPSQYTMLDASTSYLRHVVELIQPTSTGSSSPLSMQHRASLFKNVFDFDSPLPLLDWYPILLSFFQLGYASEAFYFAQRHVTSSYSCLAFLLDLLLDSKAAHAFPLDVWASLVSVRGLPRLLSLPSSSSSSTSESLHPSSSSSSSSSSSTSSRGRKGLLVMLSDEKKMQVFQTVFLQLFPTYEVVGGGHSKVKSVFLNPKSTRVDERHLQDLRTTLLKNLVHVPLAFEWCRKVPDLLDSMHALVRTVDDLTLDQLTWIVPHDPVSIVLTHEKPQATPSTMKEGSFPFRRRTVTETLYMASMFLHPDLLPSMPWEHTYITYLRQLVMDPTLPDRVHHHAQQVLQQRVPLFLPSSSSSSSNSSSSLSYEPVSASLDWVIRYLELLLVMFTTSTPKFTHAIPSIHRFIQLHFIPFLHRPPLVPPPSLQLPPMNLPEDDFGRVFLHWVHHLPTSWVKKCMKPLLAVVKVVFPYDPLGWQPWVYHFCVQYRGLPGCMKEWKTWETFLNQPIEMK
ncbi:hypothetical protein HMI54_001213 [Coelomomyces lativittatus]|nr:hypothetical protein HMI54_001213 [Coelomomyces lativittatus]